MSVDPSRVGKSATIREILDGAWVTRTGDVNQRSFRWHKDYWRSEKNRVLWYNWSDPFHPGKDFILAEPPKEQAQDCPACGLKFQDDPHEEGVTVVECGLGEYLLECDCGLCSPRYSTVGEAIEGWNRLSFRKEK